MVFGKNIFMYILFSFITQICPINSLIVKLSYLSVLIFILCDYNQIWIVKVVIIAEKNSQPALHVAGFIHFYSAMLATFTLEWTINKCILFNKAQVFNTFLKLSTWLFVAKTQTLCYPVMHNVSVCKYIYLTFTDVFTTSTFLPFYS